MQEMLLVLAGIMPIESVIDQLDEALQKYKADPSKDNLKQIEFAAILLMSKAQVERNGGDEDGIIKTMKDFDKAKKGISLLNVNEANRID